MCVYIELIFINIHNGLINIHHMLFNTDIHLSIECECFSVVPVAELY